MAQRISFALQTRSLIIIWAHRWTDLLSHRCVFFLYSRFYFYSLYTVIHCMKWYTPSSFHLSGGNWQRTLNCARRYHTHDGVFCSLCIFFSQRMSTYALLWCPPLSGGSYGLSICTSPITNDGVFLYLPLDLFCFISENPVSLLLLFISWIRPLWFPLQHVSGEANRHLSKSNKHGIYQRKMFRCLIACSGSVLDVIWMSA